MGVGDDQDWRADAASVLEWWRDAGVDTLVDDLPRDWLAQPEPQPSQPPGAPVATTQPASEPQPALPDELDAFLAWRMGDEAPEASWNADRFAPEGGASADLMILTDMPDSEGLIAGPAGRLFDRMLAAIGQSRDTIYLAGLCTARPLSGRIPPDQLDRLGEIARHHIALAAPKRVLLLGQAVSRALLGPDDGQRRGSLHAINHGDVRITAVASLHPRYLLERPAHKSEAWKDLQLLIGGIGS